jgi:FkbM family methyltransferase
VLIPLDYIIDTYNLKITGVLHCGAHTGEEAEAYHRAGINRVLWVEGNPELIPELEAHVLPYGHRVCQALITDKDDEEIVFNITNNMQSSSIYEFGTHTIVSPDVHFTHQLRLRTARLDTLSNVHNMEYLNFLNLDLQGAELVALKGLGELIQQFDYIYTEINRDELYLGCARLPELDSYLTDFKRVETRMAGDAGWGDSLFISSRLS